MTFEKVYDAFLAEIKHEHTTSATPEEFNYHIWREEIEYVTTRYFAYDQHQKPIDDLSFVNIETNGLAGMPSPLKNDGNDKIGEEFFNLPDDLLILINVSIKAKYGEGNPCFQAGELSSPIASRYLSGDREKVVNHSYYSKPSLEYPNCFYKIRNHAILPVIGNNIAQELVITYLKYPLRIEVDANGEGSTKSPFGDSQTLEIVRNAALSYLETIESPRPQTMAQIESRKFDQVPQPRPFYVNPQQNF